jgi:hypothetical protein
MLAYSLSQERHSVRWDSQGNPRPVVIVSIYHLMYVVVVRELLALCLTRTTLFRFSSWLTTVRQVATAGRQIKLYIIYRAYKAIYIVPEANNVPARNLGAFQSACMKKAKTLHPKPKTLEGCRTAPALTTHPVTT